MSFHLDACVKSLCYLQKSDYWVTRNNRYCVMVVSVLPCPFSCFLPLSRLLVCFCASLYILKYANSMKHNGAQNETVEENMRYPMLSVKGHSQGKGSPVSTALHQAIAGKLIRLLQIQTPAMNRQTFFRVIRAGQLIGSVIAQYLERFQPISVKVLEGLTISLFSLVHSNFPPKGSPAIG